MSGNPLMLPLEVWKEGFALAGKVINSRVGLGILFWACTTYNMEHGLNPRLASIEHLVQENLVAQRETAVSSEQSVVTAQSTHREIGELQQAFIALCSKCLSQVNNKE